MDDLSPEELEELAEDLKVVAQEKKSCSSEKRIDQSTEYFHKKYRLIEPGDHWKDSKTSDAVRKLEKLSFQHIFEDILAVPDCESRWQLAIRATKVLSDAINGAEEWGRKLVNGSMGEWCPNAAEKVEAFWRLFVDHPLTKRPLNTTLRNAKKVLNNCLGDYGCLEFVMEKYPADVTDFALPGKLSDNAL